MNLKLKLLVFIDDLLMHGKDLIIQQNLDILKEIIKIKVLTNASVVWLS